MILSLLILILLVALVVALVRGVFELAFAGPVGLVILIVIMWLLLR